MNFVNCIELSSLLEVIADAEQWQSREQSLRVWLDDLKDFLYDSDNILDEFECEAHRKQVIRQWNLLGKTGRLFSSSNPLAFRLKMGHQIKEIMTRLDEITARKDAFNLNRQTDFGSNSHSLWRETHSHVNAFEVIGRDSDKDEIVRRLCSPDTDNNPFIVSIVGIGGMGKTALAKLVYNDDRIICHFASRIWVCVFEDFDLKIILQKIIKYLMHKSIIIRSIHLLEVEQLQVKLQELLQDQKFLLVLDDVWSDNPSRWHELRDLLIGGTACSSVIVTTRGSKVASVGGSSYEHKLGQLSHGDSMSVFKKASEDGHGSVTNSELLEILETNY
ncbi:disease resistance protein RGA2-like [Punica granatum]|uniref:Uncharacterized protein n=2 Tax=Punica granatum TaxID=22663 RepID=A0A218XBC4_PUNGR|nr:disease resistance protein RGA2-like [Punica granatum]OWM82234.1 hypothetical protein CDL15_Pgr001808 [Punica granatum]PKI76359.1 hypothetical protein CRG98_003281 [Punica granatum]